MKHEKEVKRGTEELVFQAIALLKLAWCSDL
jgi:hypothetical protein